MKDNFNLYGKYYDLLYEDKDYDQESVYISECVKSYHPDAKTILEFGSGTGKHGLIMQKLGYDVYGLERSLEMIEVAQRQGFHCERADIEDFEIGRKFDVVMSLFHVMSYITGNDVLGKVFRNASKCLSSGGLFIFDVWYSPAVYYQKPETRLKVAENNEIRLIRFAEPVCHTDRNIVDVNYTILAKNKDQERWIEFSEKHSMRHFSIPEIKLLASYTGFEFIEAEEFLTRNLPSVHTWGVNFILKKK